MSLEDFVKSPDVAGAVGAFLGWLSTPGATLRQQLFNFTAGLGAAAFLAPLVLERSGLESHAGKMAMSFVFGLVGMNILPKLTQFAHRFDWAALLPGKKGKP